MSTQEEEREFDRTVNFLESPQSEYLDRASEKMRRSYFEMLAETLLLLENEPMTPTALFYKLHCNSKQFGPIRGFLLRKNYIQEYKMRRSIKHYYILTESGERVAELYKRVKALFTE